MPPATLPPQPAPTPKPAAPRTLPLAREAFVAAVRRDTPGTDLPRYVAVLDALLAWSAARPRLVFRTEAAPGAAIRFGLAGSTGVFWSARPTRGNAPMLEIGPPTGGALSDAVRARAMDTLNAHSRAVLADGDRLRIGFGALKNTAACAAVLGLLGELLDGPPEAPDADASSDASSDAPGEATGEAPATA